DGLRHRRLHPVGTVRRRLRAGGDRAGRLLRLVLRGGHGLPFPHPVQAARQRPQALRLPPHRVSVRYGGRPVDDTMQRAVVLFISAFVVLWLILTLLLTATGLDILTALSGALTCLTNVGPGLGE